MRPFVIKRAAPRLLPHAGKLLLASIVTCSAVPASAQIVLGTNNGGNVSGVLGMQNQGQGQAPSGTTNFTRSDFGNRLPDSGPAGNQSDVLNALAHPASPVIVQAAPVITPAPPPYVPGEFEIYVQNLEPTLQVHRLGYDLMQQQGSAASPGGSSLVPPDYVIAPGDELDVAISGSIDANVQLIVDRSGRITLPGVGSIMVSGTRYADLPALLTRQVSQRFRNFKLSVALGQLRGMRIFMTGFVARPGSMSVSSLSTVSSALISAGGPTAAGSFRDIEVLRGGSVISHFDLYDLILGGKRSSDIVLQPDDVVHVGPVGPQVAVLGSVNQPSILELKSGDDLAAAIGMAGGLSSVADGSRVTIEPLADRSASRVVKASLPADGNHGLERGDVVNVYSAVDARQPTVRQNKRIIVEGEVAHPGVFVLPAHATINDALAQAGGLTANAYLFGTEFTRKSVRQTQRLNYDKLLNDLQVKMEETISTQRVDSTDDAKVQAARAASASRLLEQLRTLQPTGRMVLLTDPATQALPNMEIQDGDRLFIPPVPTAVGVFGSVFNTGSFVYVPGRRLGDYVDMSGGPTLEADKRSEFVLRANGTVISNLQTGHWYRDDPLRDEDALPGDTIFIPQELDKLNGLEVTRTWSQIVFQMGLGLAGIAAAVK